MYSADILAAHPYLFERKKLDPTQSNMYWGIAVEEGWLPLVKELAEKLEVYNNNNPSNKVQFEQIKQKFGSLRVYLEPPNSPKAHDIVNQFEERSQMVCEVCGDAGKQRVLNMWWSVLCESHFEEQKAHSTI